jgi:hypothetical protein
LIALGSNAQALQDTTHPNGKRGRATIQVIPCPCDSNNIDSFVMMPVEFDDIQKTVTISPVYRFDHLKYCLKTIETICWRKYLIDDWGNAMVRDTQLENGRWGKMERFILPVVCDSTIMIFRSPRSPSSDYVNNWHQDTNISFIRYQYCLDTIETLIWQKSILDIADSLAIAMNVPPQLVYEIGLNESKWPMIYDHSYLIVFGDLQVIDRTFDYFYEQLGLKGGKTRINYLIIGIYYLRQNYEQQGSWQKARYAYGRGFWKPPNRWTALERHFMNKIDWRRYD